MKAATTIEREETYAVLTQALREVHGTDAQLEAWTSDAQFTEHGKKRVVRYDLEVRLAGLPQPQCYSWVGKYYEDEEKALLVASVLRMIGGSDAARAAGLVVPTVLPYHSPSHLLFLTYESGESVATAISQETGTILATIGRALAALHAMRITPPTTTSPETVLEDLRPKVEELSSWLPGKESRLRRAFAQLEDQTPKPPSPISFVHNDFGPANLLWRAGELVVLDFDRCTQGDPALDLGNFLVQLRRSSIRHPERLINFALARRALLEEYGRWCSSDPILEARVAWYERAILLRKIHRFWDETKNPEPELDARQIALRQRLLRVFLEDTAQQGGNQPESESVGGRGTR